MSVVWCKPVAGGVRLTVQIQPNAKRSEIIGVHDDALKLRVQAPALEGKANDAVIRFFAEQLRIPKSSVLLVHGQTSRKKVLELRGDHDADQIARQLLPSV